MFRFIRSNSNVWLLKKKKKSSFFGLKCHTYKLGIKGKSQVFLGQIKCNLLKHWSLNWDISLMIPKIYTSTYFSKKKTLLKIHINLNNFIFNSKTIFNQFKNQIKKQSWTLIYFLPTWLKRKTIYIQLSFQIQTY